jgi:hypothetical protein
MHVVGILGLYISALDLDTVNIGHLKSPGNIQFKHVLSGVCKLVLIGYIKYSEQLKEKPSDGC